MKNTIFSIVDRYFFPRKEDKKNIVDRYYHSLDTGYFSKLTL